MLCYCHKNTFSIVPLSLFHFFDDKLMQTVVYFTIALLARNSSGKLVHSTGRSARCDDLERWDREGGREAQEGGDMGIYVYV